jgi:hypothetical protein
MSNAGLKGGQGGQQVVEMSAAKPWASVESSSGKEAGGIIKAIISTKMVLPLIGNNYWQFCTSLIQSLY